MENQKNNTKKKIKNEEILQMPEKPIKPQQEEIKGAPCILFIVGILEVIGGICLEFAFVSICGGFVALFSLIGIFAQIESKRLYQKRLRNYEKDLFEYNKKLKKYNTNLPID